MKLTQARLISAIHAHFGISIVTIGALICHIACRITAPGRTLMPDSRRAFCRLSVSLPGTSLNEMSKWEGGWRM